MAGAQQRRSTGSTAGGEPTSQKQITKIIHPSTTVEREMTSSSFVLTPIFAGLIIFAHLHASLAFSPTPAPTYLQTAIPTSNNNDGDQHDHSQRAVIISVVVVVGAVILVLLLAIAYWCLWRLRRVNNI